MARFIFREQFEASSAFEAMYDGAMAKIIETSAKLVARLKNQPLSPEIRMLTLTILGQIIIFQTSRAMVLRTMDWEKVGADQLQGIQSVMIENTKLLLA